MIWMMNEWNDDDEWMNDDDKWMMMNDMIMNEWID